MSIIRNRIHQLPHNRDIAIRCIHKPCWANPERFWNIAQIINALRLQIWFCSHVSSHFPNFIILYWNWHILVGRYSLLCGLPSLFCQSVLQSRIWRVVSTNFFCSLVCEADWLRNNNFRFSFQLQQQHLPIYAFVPACTFNL